MTNRYRPEDHPAPGQIRRGVFILNPWVFGASSVIILGFALFGIVQPEVVGDNATALQGAIATYFGWFYIGAVAFILVFMLWLALSKYGNIRLGPNDSRPEFGTVTWFAMLFSAGMGIGLLFWSVAEPVMHFATPPENVGGDAARARQALNITFFHWGLHPWAIYTLVGLSLAYFSFRRKHPLTIRSAFYPLIGERIYGPIGNIIDTTAVVSTLFGVATSLGLGVLQINAGLNHVFNLPEGVVTQISLIAFITLIATISVVSGIHVGIRRLSELNVGVGVLLCLFLLVVGPTVFLAELLVQSIGYYLQHLPETTMWTATFLTDSEWQAGWTLFYWGWWIAWSPFVGMFIARVSRGRTIREFVLGVMIVPSLVTFAWLSIFGGSALYEQLEDGFDMVGAVNESVPVAMFVLFEQFPYGAVASVAATLVIMSFFVTSSDSGSLVIDILTSGGHPDPPIVQRVFWAVTEGVVAAVLLYSGYASGNPEGGLNALQTAAITTGLPFCVLLVLMMWGVLRGLRQEKLIYESPVFEPPDDHDSVYERAIEPDSPETEVSGA